MTALVVALTVVVALLAVLVVGLLRSHADILAALHDLGANLDPNETATAASDEPSFTTRDGVASPATTTGNAADLVGRTPDGGAVHLAVTGVPHHSLLAFLSSGCLTCREFWDAFATGAANDLPGIDTRLVAVTKGPDDESESTVRSLAPHTIPTVMSSEAWEDFGVPVAPYFILVDGPTGSVVGEGAATSWSHVRELLQRAMDDNRSATRRATGDSGGDEPKRHPNLSTGDDREARVDDELLAAGIGPDDSSLHPDRMPFAGEGDRNPVGDR
jgi:hypothetical protein